jgi:tetratricopeptide (TPR) repeat protein
MITEKSLKYIFYAASVLLLVIMIILSRNAGISCDEVLHYEHSESVFNFFSTNGRDVSALDTPDSHLKYYGQSYDNVVTFLANWFNIEDIYSFRHVMSSIAGWIIILVTALFAVWLSGYRTGIIVIFLFAISPVFMGHSQNNLKDIPFALGYIASIFFMLKLLFDEESYRFGNILLLTLSMGFALSIRAGGLLLICYLFLFSLIKAVQDIIINKKEGVNRSIKLFIIIILISGAAYFLGILLWPYALQDPLRNVYDSYKVMAHFPATFRQIFEGKVIWSDFVPWYYLPKSMVITIPVVVLTGFIAFFAFTRKIVRFGKALIYGLVLFTIIFPVIFVMVEKSNLYSSWRQFLFVYPSIILFAAAGFDFIFSLTKSWYYKLIPVVLILVFAIPPIRYMAQNWPYSYFYYNILTGGLKGAYGNYETDYYYVGQTEASEWLIDYLNKEKIDSAVIKATFPVNWQFRNYPGIRTSYFRFEERSHFDWDYAIVTNRYIHPFRLKRGGWPPENTIHTVYADNVPVGAVLERLTKADFYGFRALEEGRTGDAIGFFEEALQIICDDEMIFYNFARGLYNDGQFSRADSVLKECLGINPEFEPALMYLGNIAKAENRPDDASGYYKKLININRKYKDAYVELAEIIAEKDVLEARQLLRDCLTIDPSYKPAIRTLADTYRESDPDIAEKYDKLIETLE